MNRKTALLLILLVSALLAGCGGRSDQPLPPTSIPLAEPVSSEASSPAGSIPPEQPIFLPEGFQINVFAAGLNSPKMMAFGPDQILYLTESATGRILRLPDRDGDGAADGIETAAEDLLEPSGLAFYEDGSLYAAETTRVFRLSDPDGDGYFQDRETIVSGISAGGNTNRTIRFTLDWRRFFLTVGSSCNVCQEQDPRRGSILLYRPDGTFIQIYSQGLRYVVGLDYHPLQNTLWAAVVERDGLAAGLPPETVYTVNIDSNAGWPFCHAGRIVDPDFGSKDSCSTDLLTPVIELESHTAPYGIAFYDGDQFPAEYQTDLFIALHGSGQGKTAAGYKIVRKPLGDDLGPVEDFAVGWLGQDGTPWGAPMDLVVGPDGSLYLSDDLGGTIYRIHYEG